MLNQQKSELEFQKLEREDAEERIRKTMEKEREKAIKEVTEHFKQEMEALRGRFKLVTCANMERCPSETSLEKVEVSETQFPCFSEFQSIFLQITTSIMFVQRNDVIELAKHDMMITQLKLDMEIEMGEVREKEETAYKKQLEELTAKCEEEKMVTENASSLFTGK